MALDERQEKFWRPLQPQLGSDGTPEVVCSTITPFPFWAVVASMVIFIPLALIVSFFVKRQAVLIQAGELIVLDLSFWRLQLSEERVKLPLAPGAAELDGSALLIEGTKYHLQPGWKDLAERVVELCDRAPTTSEGEGQ